LKNKKHDTRQKPVPCSENLIYSEWAKLLPFRLLLLLTKRVMAFAAPFKIFPIVALQKRIVKVFKREKCHYRQDGFSFEKEGV